MIRARQPPPAPALSRREPLSESRHDHRGPARGVADAEPGQDVAGVNRVLNAAALTYVAAFVATLGNLLYLLSIRNRD